MGFETRLLARLPTATGQPSGRHGEGRRHRRRRLKTRRKAGGEKLPTICRTLLRARVQDDKAYVKDVKVGVASGGGGEDCTAEPTDLPTD